MRWPPWPAACKARANSWDSTAASTTALATTRARLPATWPGRKASRCGKRRSPAGIFSTSSTSVIYHLDCPVAGPGSFPQYMVSQSVKGQRKVVLGGQGGDEIFGGYVRYLIAYFEQCLKGAIGGVPDPSKFIVTYESIIPNLKSLRGYEPLMAHFFGQGMFDDYDKRYYRLIDRSGSLGKEIRWESFPDYDPYDSFREVFFGIASAGSATSTACCTSTSSRCSRPCCRSRTA